MKIESLIARFRSEYAEGRVRMKQMVNGPRRRIFLLIVFLVLLWFVWPWWQSDSRHTHASACLSDRLRHWRLLQDSGEVGIRDSGFSMVGNGFLGVAWGEDRQLRVSGTSSSVLSQAVGLYPLISATVDAFSNSVGAFITDYRNGVAKHITCFSQDDECVCVMQSVYAHRRRPNVLVQDIQISNPMERSIRVALALQRSSSWIEDEKVGNTVVQTRFISSDSDKLQAAVICTNVPETIAVQQKREENFRFICVLDHANVPGISDDPVMKKVVIERVIKIFTEITAPAFTSAQLDKEHESGWHTLNEVNFGLSASKAPQALQADEINSTRYGLLSNVRAPLLEVTGSRSGGEPAASMQDALSRNELCYTGHSTLLVPSRLWTQPDTMEKMIAAASVWMMTLEKRGCVHLLKAGASGVAQAFVLSLGALRFAHDHLELGIDPGDIHRDMSITGLLMTPTTRVSISIRIEDDNRLALFVASSSHLFACDAACRDAPVALSSKAVRLPVKITRPLTPILYLARDRKHLEQLQGTIHVVEVVDAPAREHELLAIHKHGHRLGGLPTLFWLILGILVAAFHLFLFKLLYSEWRKNDTTPYNSYLRQRYMRNH